VTTVALLGYGYWGRNVARAMRENGLKVVVFDPSPQAMVAAAEAGFAVFESQAQGIDSSEAVAVCTPPDQHESIIGRALQAGRHVWTEKPIAQDIEHAVALVRSRGKVLFVDHTFTFAPAVELLRGIISLDGVSHVDSARTHLCSPREGTDVVGDLLPHDVSILLACGIVPRRVQVRGASAVDCHVELDLSSAANASATSSIYLSWSSAFKQRRMVFYGDSRTVVYDHLDPRSPIKIYTAKDGGRGTWMQGPVSCPPVSSVEPLAIAVRRFAAAMRGEDDDNAADALLVESVVDAASRSIQAGPTVVSYKLLQRSGTVIGGDSP
jgi:UDP-2-acetamido-3-amino-2,3-dideoxy-glucuronate N-acetyltransferase